MTLRRTPLRKVSTKRAAELKIYGPRRAAFLLNKPTCEICHIKKSHDVHHKAGRLAGNYLNESTWLAVCRPCHDYIHTHPSLARKQGWII